MASDDEPEAPTHSLPLIPRMVPEYDKEDPVCGAVFDLKPRPSVQGAVQESAPDQGLKAENGVSHQAESPYQPSAHVTLGTGHGASRRELRRRAGRLVTFAGGYDV